MNIFQKMRSLRTRAVSRFIRVSVYRKIQNGHYQTVSSDCPVCGGLSRRSVTERDRYALPVNIWLCSDCGMVYQSPRLDRRSLEQFYRNEYRLLYRGTNYISEDYIQRGVRRGKAIDEFLRQHAGSPGGTILELGCGPGGILKHFAEKGHKVTGTEWDRCCVQSGRSLGINMIMGGTDELASAGKKFDLIILNHLLEHVEKPRAFLEVLKPLFNPDGILFIEVPGLHNPGTNETFTETAQIAHLHYFDAVTLGQLAADAGYRTDYIDETCRYIGAPSDDQNDISLRQENLKENAGRNELLIPDPLK